ncbi:MAG: hypothetical protein JXJ04_16415, partial [Spirochaetales bacterium]|nr:hypothetical protein [Spirochaetales bacterium]
AYILGYVVYVAPDKVTKFLTRNGGDGDVGGVNNLTKSQQNAIKSLEKQIAKHTAKLEAFKKNPTIRPGMENLPKEVIKKQ